MKFLSDLENDCNVFDAIKSLYNLESINITESEITEIPVNAFHDSSLRALTVIGMSGGKGGRGGITRIGKNAFDSLNSKKIFKLLKIFVKQ